MTTLMEIARSVTLGELLKNQRDAVTVGEDEPLADALASLKRSGLHALVVLDAHNRPSGVVSRHDVLRAVSDTLPDRHATVRALAAPVRDAVRRQADAQDGLYQYPSHAKMEKALEMFGLGARHLVVSGPFIDAPADRARGGDKALRVLAQVDIVGALLTAYLGNEVKRLDEGTTLSKAFASPVSSAVAAPAQVTTVEAASASALQALRLLVGTGLNAAPAVDARGAITGQVSSDAVVSLLDADGEVLPSLAFLERTVADSALLDTEPATAAPGDDLASAASALLDKPGTHRLWVCDKGGRPVSVLSCSDIVFAVGGEDALRHDAESM